MDCCSVEMDGRDGRRIRCATLLLLKLLRLLSFNLFNLLVLVLMAVRRRAVLLVALFRALRAVPENSLDVPFVALLFNMMKIKVC